MLKKLFTLLSLCLFLNAQTQTINPLKYAAEFEAAYAAYPTIPNGILEGVAFAQTRIQHITGNNQGCSGIPQVSGVMGLTQDGKGYFKNNLAYISNLSGISILNIKTNPSDNILAYASAYAKLMDETGIAKNDFYAHDQILKTLSEIPWDKNPASNYALSCFTYEVFNFINNSKFQTLFNLPLRTIDLTTVYGADNLAILSSERINISTNQVIDKNLHEFEPRDRSVEFGPAIWNAAPACNYSSRAGIAVSAVTIHTIQGSYAGAISWAQNCISNVSYHYVARSSDGQITQMVLEANKAWHVGSENPYTIGIEHEGYVDDPIWYTEAMYTGSADLVRDITESGYGISPLRTFQGPATAATLTLGGCTRIKGHQHFPGASHTDPGINWNWEHYYQLINDTPDITTYTLSSGTLFDSGGAASQYDDDERFLYLIQPADVTSITLSIVSFSLEEDWDYMYIYDGSNADAPLIGKYTGTDIPDIITSSGGSILLEFRSDCATLDDGWEINWTSIEGTGEGDELPPITEVIIEETWFTENFETEFLDLDDSLGSGVKHQFYQVIDNNGIEWRANDNNGFFSDNFDIEIHADWTNISGTWNISDEVLVQSNEDLNNTNIYANLNQTDFDSYFYHWSGKIGGIGADKRAGLHFMCDNPTLLNRGNSYFVYFREDNNRVQIYKVNEDVFSLAAQADYDFSADAWYDFKTVYDKATGQISVWVNNVHIISWTDDSPLMTGDAVSFRSGNAIYAVNNFKVYHNRVAETIITIGPIGDARYQNNDPYSPAAKIKSIIIDSALNISTISAVYADIDWTPPLDILYINDGEGADIATTTSNTELSANWSSTTDENSDIARYWYAIGTIAGGVDVADWTDNWYADTVNHTGLSLVLGETYYFSVVAENGAGLFSDTIISNGQLLIEPTEVPVAGFVADHTNLCGLDSIQLENGSIDALTYEWFIPDGSPTYSTEINPYIHFEAAGIYPIKLVATGPGGTDTSTQSIAVYLDDPPISTFTPSAVLVLLDEALITFDNSSLNTDGYYWSFGDGSTSTDEAPWHTYEAVGDYMVSLIAINGDCPNDTSETLIKVREANEITELTQANIAVYPNPATDFILITNTSLPNQNFNYQIFDAAGRLVLDGKNLNFEADNKISIIALAKGVYQLKVIVEGFAISKKIIVK